MNITIGLPKEVIHIMNRVSRHRGTEDPIVQHCSERMYMGHIRLPIQGLSSDYAQPYETEKLVMCYVGELFNIKEIMGCYEQDTNHLAHQLSRASGLFKYVPYDGFWSVATWLKQNKDLVLYTDWLAKKPLYVRRIQDNQYMVSSEIQPLLVYKPHLLHADELYFSRVNKWGYCPEDTRTPYIEINKLPPGTMTVIDETGGLGTRELTQPMEPNDNMYEYPALYDVLSRAVFRRTLSDIPVAMLCSGGVDSTIVYSLLCQSHPGVKVFHVENDEENWLKYLGIPKENLVRVSIADVTDEEAQDVMGTPVDLGSVKPQIALGKAIKKHGIHVVLSGDGADELFGGYRRSEHYDSQCSDIWDELVCYHMPRLDACMMRSTIELRCPFLSWPVVHAAMRMPYKDRINKWGLKLAFEGLVPEEILQREKRALKITEIREDKEARRYAYVDLFRRRYFDERNRCTGVR
jgi:asparagine synthase (glutamine-hydrolysing)